MKIEMRIDLMLFGNLVAKNRLSAIAAFFGKYFKISARDVPDLHAPAPKL